MLRFIENKTNFDGLFTVTKTVITDSRGYFERLFSPKELKCWGNRPIMQVNRTFTKIKGTIRGLHFQNPPYECAKLIFCLKGRVMDVVIDLRKKSNTFLKCFNYELSAEKSEILYIPSGFGHAFLGLDETNILLYNIDQVYSKENDTGILWNSSNFVWPINNPKISDRDNSFIQLKNFISPF